MSQAISKALVAFGSHAEEYGDDEFGVIEDLPLIQRGGDSAIYGLRKPYRLQALWLLWKKALITRKEMGKKLGDLYIEDEFPAANCDIDMLLELFNSAEKEDVMSPEDYAAYNKLPKQLTIYRGLQFDGAKVESMSWTLNKDIAKWFAHRWLKSGEKGRVFSTNVPLSAVLMYNNEREEEEVVIDPSFLEDIKELATEAKNEQQQRNEQSA